MPAHLIAACCHDSVPHSSKQETFCDIVHCCIFGRQKEGRKDTAPGHCVALPHPTQAAPGLPAKHPEISGLGLGCFLGGCLQTCFLPMPFLN